MLPSGRVRYFPMSNVTADDQFQSLLTGEHYRVTVRKAVVDSAYWTFDIPSSRPPRYSVVPGVRCVPPNAIPQAAKQEDDFVVVGPGKTGIDSCLWLLERGIDPERIRWVMPNDAWFINRANIQPGDDFFLTAFQSLAQQFEALSAADDVADLFDRLEASGELLRLDPGIRPTIYRCATITEDELAQLQAHQKCRSAGLRPGCREHAHRPRSRRDAINVKHVGYRLQRKRHLKEAAGPDLVRQSDKCSNDKNLSAHVQRSAHRLHRSDVCRPKTKKCAVRAGPKPCYRYRLVAYAGGIDQEPRCLESPSEHRAMAAWFATEQLFCGARPGQARGDRKDRGAKAIPGCFLCRPWPNCLSCWPMRLRLI